MRGLGHLLRLRMGGYLDGQRRVLGDAHIRSVHVTVCDETPAYGQFTDPENGYTGRAPEIDIHPADVIETLDLRCLRGLEVLVYGANADRVREFCRRATQFLPAKLMVCLPDSLVTWEAGHYQKFPLENAA